MFTLNYFQHICIALRKYLLTLCSWVWETYMLSVHTHLLILQILFIVNFFFPFFGLQIQNLIYDTMTYHCQWSKSDLFVYLASLVCFSLINTCAPSTQLKDENITSNLHLTMCSSPLAYSCLWASVGLICKIGQDLLQKSFIPWLYMLSLLCQ